MALCDYYLKHADSANRNALEIRDEGDFRSLYFKNEQLQSRMSLSSPHHLVLSYTRYMTLPLLTQTPLKNILVIGIGSGSFIRFFHHHHPDCCIDAVDYSSEVIKAARGCFMLPEDNLITISCADGFNFLRACPESKYDLILVDAFDDSGMAPTIYNDSFLALCSQHLTETGWVSCNLWSNDKKKFAEIKRILADNFEGILYLPVPDRGNIVAVATKTEIPWPKILQNKKKIQIISKKYSIDFYQVVKIAKQKNMCLTQKLSAMFQ